ncbi:protein AATF-like [Penaeus chinensis]|uniref:protein AATF-like n=1 Tax=Penaeus chinensis TaxID=139456 RepID=UPI001FB74407|nr:protein AATF-like [Penaeus chinensis]
MANALQSYVEKYLLNPAASFNVDDEDQVITKAQVVDSVAKEESADQIGQSRSKLRAQSAALLSESDPRYKGKKVSRKDLKKDNEVTFDPSLSKFFVIEGDEEEEGSDENEDEEDGEDEEEDGEEEEEEESGDEDESEEESVTEVNTGLKKMALKQAVKKNKARDEELDESMYSEEEDESTRKIRKRLQNDSSEFTFDKDGDFSKYGEDFEDDDEDDDNDDDDEDLSIDEEEGIDSESGYGGSLKKFSSEDQSEEVRKGRAVKSQLEIYDSLFESRITMQKMVSQTNQLPQCNTFKLFVRENDPNYTKNLSTAKSATKVLLNTLLDIQELILKKNPETQHIITGKQKKDMGTESDEEITSSEDEKMEEEEQKESSKGTKRKLKMEEYDELLSKRHAAYIPFRDETINRWYEKTKLLSSRNAQNSFSSFEVSALQQMKNILGNKQQLIQRTQLTGATRGTAYHILGHKDSTNTEVGKEEYDPEIFDDSDFYTRSLEEVLKAKVALSEDMTDVSRKWIEIQNLRKKAKKKVDTKASKGRKIRFDVMSKLQQYLAPCYPPQMDDGATNILFASLFGNAVKNVPKSKTEPVTEEQK